MRHGISPGCELTFDDRPGIGIRPLQRALKTGNLTLIRNAAGELPRVELSDALVVCVAMRETEPERFERAALHWLPRFCLERPQATHAQVQSATWAFQNIT